LVGRIIEPNLLPVPSGTVYLVPAADVETLSETPIDLFLPSQDTAALAIDEPIEDLLDLRCDGGTNDGMTCVDDNDCPDGECVGSRLSDNADSYEQAEVDASGVYRFETLPEGRHFVVWTPAAGDNEHLPGGDSSSVSFDTASLVGMQLDIRVSSQPSSSATYVGSSTCMVCHGLHSTTRTAHMVGLQVPGVRSLLQDVGPWPDFDDGLAAFDASTDLYYFNCSASASTPEDPSNCDVSTSNPGVFDFRVDLRRDLSKPLGVIGAYYIDMINGTTERYEVVLTYGGAVEKQQYLARSKNMDGSFSYFVLPLQYNYQGDASNPDPDDWPWRDYRSDLWYDVGTDALRQPARSAIAHRVSSSTPTPAPIPIRPRSSWVSTAAAATSPTLPARSGMKGLPTLSSTPWRSPPLMSRPSTTTATSA
jgi:hypothetical protein